MKPIKQTKFGPVEGNCFAACIASILHVAIEEVKITMTDEKWWETTQAYLATRNFYFLEVRIDAAINYPFYAMDGIYCIFSGKSPRTFAGHDGTNHCVVGVIKSTTENPVIYEMTHDPHPDGTGLKPGTIWGLGFLIPLNPSLPTVPKSPDVCEWKFRQWFMMETGCELNLGSAHYDAAVNGKYKNCPHCGRKIKLPNIVNENLTHDQNT